jgi:polyhydroxybutyrate depolymerase
VSALLLILVPFLAAAKPAAKDLTRRDWTIDGVQREALVYAPADAKTTAAPLVFAFHGHTGTMRSAARSFHIHQLWPEAIVVYMQGLPTPGLLVDKEGKFSGWQHTVGDENDRDLKFFDAVLKSIQEEYKVDPHRIYAMGHSNGGGFTYVLWSGRGDLFAAVAPMCSVDFKELNRYTPKPVLVVAGEQDKLVKFEWSQKMINALRKINGCESDGKKESKSLTVYPSPGDTPLATYIYDGGHGFPQEVLPVIVNFFKHHELSEPSSASKSNGSSGDSSK